MNLLSWLGDMFSSGGSNASGSRGGSGKGVYIPDPFGRLGQGSWKPIDRMPDPFGRLPAPDSFGGKSPERENTGVPLLRPVGMTGDNRPSDVMKVENMLGKTGHLDLGATNGPTGYFGARTEQAVKGFQKDHGLKVDGLLNPNGETIRALGAATGSGEASPGMGLTGHRSDPVGHPQTGGKAPVGPDAGTGTRQSKPGEEQVAQAAAFVEPAAASVLALLAGKKFSDIVAETPASGGSKSGDGGSAGPVPKLTPEAALKLFGTNPAFIGKSIYDRFGAGNDKGTGQQQLDAIDKPLPNRTEFPAAAPKRPDRTETPADPPRLPDRPKNPIPNPEKPAPETFPDQSGEFEGFNIQEVRTNIDLDAGEDPHPGTRKMLGWLPANQRETIEKHLLNGGIQTVGGVGDFVVEQDRSFDKGEADLRDVVQGFGGNPADIKTTIKDGKTIRHFEQGGVKIRLRPMSSRKSHDRPTLEIEIERPELSRKLSFKQRYKAL